MSGLYIAKLRAKAQHARELADLCGDARASANLRSYAAELDAEADEGEVEPDGKANEPAGESESAGPDGHAGAPPPFTPGDPEKP